MPKVSVIMNCLNGERYVRQAIESVYAQTFTDWEIVFWDNASTDRTAEIARSYDQRLRYFRNESTVPLGTARRQAMAEARGQWIAFLDHDDYYLPHRFERQFAAIGTADYALSYAGYREIDAAGAFIRNVVPQNRSGMILPDLLRNFDIGILATLVNADYLKRYRIRIDESFIVAEDYQLFLQLAAKGPVLSISDVVAVYRVTPGNWSVKGAASYPDEFYETLTQLRRDNPGIEQLHADAFRIADARVDYYRARVLMQHGKSTEARKLMRHIVRIRPLYCLFYFMSFWPSIWLTVHDPVLKRRLTNLLPRHRSL